MWGGPAAAVAVPLLLAWLPCTAIALLDPETNPDMNSGHRAGAEGYPSDPSQPCENTLEALEALAAADNGPNGPVLHLQYVEIDVHETQDAQLAVLHDAALAPRSFPACAANAEAFAALAARGLDPATARVRDVTLAELQTLHLGGRRGLRVPSLQQFMEGCAAAQLRRPLVVEVKSLQSDAGRAALLQALRWYQERVAAPLAATHPERCSAAYGFMCVIAFPPQYAASFGRVGSAAERAWAARLAEAGMPVKCCCFHHIVYNRAFLPRQQMV